jgi:hypothetical protein
MDYWEKEGFILSDVVDNIKKRGDETLEIEYTWAHNMALNSQALVHDSTLSVDELKSRHIDLLQKIKRLKDVINGSLDKDPDKAHFASVIMVTYEDDTQIIINEGINEKIFEKYKNTILTLQEAVTIVEQKLKYAPVTNAGEEPGFEFTSNKERALFLHYSGLYDYLTGKGLTEVDLAKVISYFTKEKPTAIRVELNGIKKYKIAKKYNNDFFKKEKVELVLNTLRDCKLSTKELDEVYKEIVSNQ